MAREEPTRRTLRVVLRVGTLLLLVAATALGAPACGGGGGGGETAIESGQLVELSGVGPVAQTFDEARGKPRLVLLLSPT